MYEVGDQVAYWELHWQSDWNGYEVGYPEIDIVGFYTIPETETNLYVDVETAIILEIWEYDDE